MSDGRECLRRKKRKAVPTIKKVFPKTATGDTIMRMKHVIAIRSIAAGLLR
jgi:hypothetical protein